MDTKHPGTRLGISIVTGTTAGKGKYKFQQWKSLLISKGSSGYLLQEIQTASPGADMKQFQKLTQQQTN